MMTAALMEVIEIKKTNEKHFWYDKEINAYHINMFYICAMRILSVCFDICAMHVTSVKATLHRYVLIFAHVTAWQNRRVDHAFVL